MEALPPQPETGQNVARLRADGLAQSNFSRPLTDGDEHNIHNADAAHDQRDRSHSREHDRLQSGESDGRTLPGIEAVLKALIGLGDRTKTQ